jgi:predicted Zn-dependent protease with MMP-like domain
VGAGGTIRPMAKRRRGDRLDSRLGDRRADPGEAAFEALVDRALEGIPDPFRRVLEEVAIVIEDEPTDDQLDDNGVKPGGTLYGLYEGVPRTEWGADFALFANRISLFRFPLEDDFSDSLELELEVRRTVVHELAHHLGIDDDRLDELGAG